MADFPITPNTKFEDLLSQVAVPKFGQFNKDVNYQDFLSAVQQNLTGKQNPLVPTPISPFKIDISGRFPLQALGYDNEDLYAQGQTGLSKAFNATIKGLGLVGTTFLQGTIGLANGVLQAIADGKFSSLYDNEFNRSLDNFTKKLENDLPNYYSKAERERPWYQNIFTANFIWNKIVKNLGFAGGAILAGNTYNALLNRMFVAAKMTAAGKAMDALKMSEALADAKSLAAAEQTYTKFLGQYNLLNQSQRAVVSGLSTFGEASIEALQASDELRKKLIEEYRLNNGGVTPTGDDLQRINNTVANAGNTVFGLNTLILTASNYLQFPKLLSSGNKAERGMYAELVKEAQNVGFDAKTLKYIQEPATKFGKLFNKVRPYTFSVTEGLEEASQYAAQTGSENYWYKKYEAGDEMDLNFFQGIKEAFTGNAMQDLYGHGLSEALSPEGQEQFFIGGVSGALMKSRGTFAEQREKGKNTSDLINSANAYNLSSYAKDSVDSLKRGAQIGKTMEDSLRQGEILEYKDAQRDYLVNYLFPKIKYGRLDLVNEEVNTYRQLASTSEGFQQLVEEGKALATDTQESYLQRLDNILETAKSMDLAYKALKTASAFQYVENSEGKAVPKYSDKVIEQLIYASSKIQDYDKRIPELTAKLATTNIDPSQLPDKYDEYNQIIEGLVDFNGKSITDDLRTELKTDLQDVVEMTLRRKQYIQEYNDLLNNPTKFTEKTQKTAKPTIKLVTRDGEKDIEVGEEYVLGELEKETNIGLPSKKFPGLKILAENEDGSLKIQDSSGNIRNISKEELKPYKLAKLSDIKKNPKALFYWNNRDRIFKYKFKGRTEEGLLRWSDTSDELFFEYLKNGKPRRIRVNNKDFSYEIARQKGFKEPIITATNASAQDISEAEKLAKQEESIQNKLDKRKSMLSDYVSRSKDRLTKVKEEIENKKKVLSDTLEAIDNLNKTKQGLPRKKFTKAITKTLQDLGKLKYTTSLEISQLEDERDELETILPYFEDMLANIRELSENTLDLVEDLKEDISHMEELIDNTSSAIKEGKSLIETIDSALRTAYSLLNDYIRRIKEENPDIPFNLDEYKDKLEKYLGEEGARYFIENNEGYTTLIKSLTGDILGFTEELEIKPNEEKIEKLEKQLKELESGLKDLISEQLAKAKLLEFFEDRIKEERKKTAEQEAALKNEELQKEIFKSQEVAQESSGINTGDITDPQSVINGQIVREDYKKPTSILFSSTTSRSEDYEPDSQVADNVVRERNFLYNQEYFDPEVKNNLKIITVTLDQENSLGLPGIIEVSARQNTQEGWDKLSKEELNKKVTDVDNGVILAVYVLDKNGELFYINEDGKIVGKVGEPTDIDKVVSSTLSSTSTTWRDGSPRYRGKDKALAEELSGQWRSAREQMFQKSQTHDITFSRGVPVYNKENDQYVLSNPTGILYPEEMLSIVERTQEVIKVMTEDQYTPFGQQQPFPVSPGRVYFQYNGIFAPLINRQFSPEEQETIYEVLVKLSEQALSERTLKGQYLTFLQNTLFWGTPKNKPGRNQIWISTENGLQLNFGNNNQSVPFTPLNLQDPSNKALIMAYLSGTYNNINNHTLTQEFNEPFTEFFIDKGILQSKEHVNYQSYLLNKSLVQTPVASNEDSPDGRNFKQKYAILHGIEFTPKEQTSNVGDIEAKKADIERRRQEELKTTKNIGEDKLKEGRENTKKIVESLKQRYPATSVQGIIIRILEKLIDFSKYSTIIDSEYINSRNASGQATWFGMMISQETLDGILAGKEHEVHTFIHEFIHGFTTSKISAYNIEKQGLIPGFKSELTAKEKNAIEQLQRIFEKVKRDNPKSKEYGFTNLDEFIAEAFSNSGFQYTLKNTKAEGKKSNLFSEFINAVGDLLFEQLERWAKRFNKEIPQRDTITGILEDVLAWTEDLIDQNNKLAHIATNEEINAKYDAELVELEKQNREQVGSVVEGKERMLQGEKRTAKTSKGETLVYIGRWVNPEENEVEVQVDVNAGDFNKVVNRLMGSGMTEEDAQDRINNTVMKDFFENVPKPQNKPKTINVKPAPDEEFRTIGEFSVERMDDAEKAEFQTFVKENLPQFSTKEVEDIITMANNKQAWGRLVGKVLEFYKKAEKGTGYHEAFEGVWKYFVTPDEKIELLNEFKNKEGFFNDRVSGERVAFNDATDEQAKEQMADDFAAYRLNSKKSLTEKIKAFFDRLIKFFRGFLRGFKENTSLRDELFKKISKGGFKNYTLPDNLSQTPEYSTVRGITEAQANAIVQDMIKRTLTTLLRDSVDLMDIESYKDLKVLENLRSYYRDERGLMDALPNGEKSYNELETRLKEFLRTLSITFDENQELIINDENRNKNDYTDDKFMVDVKKTSPFAIKFLITSLAKVTGVSPSGGISYDTSSGAVEHMQQLLPFSRSFVRLMESLENSVSFDNMMERFHNLVKSDLDFLPLLRMLGGKGDSIDLNNLQAHQWRLLTALYDTFNMQKAKTDFLVFDDDGQVYFRDAYIGRSVRNIVRQWTSDILSKAREGKGIFTSYDPKDKLFKINKGQIKKPVTLKDQIKFLNDLGIQVTESDINKLSSFKKFGRTQQSEKGYFLDQINKIRTYISAKEGLASLTPSALGISKPLNDMAQILVNANKPESESTFPNADGEQQQVWIQPNYYSDFVKKFNTVKSLDELYEFMPHLKVDIFARNSQLLKKGGIYFDTAGKRTDSPLNISYTDGVFLGDRGVKNGSLTKMDRLMNRINAVLSKKFYISVPADGSTEWTIDMDPFIAPKAARDNFQEKLWSIFKDYYEDEIELSKEDRSFIDNVGKKSKDLRFFKDIIKKKNSNPDQVKADLLEFTNKIKEKLEKNLIDNQEIIENGDGTYSFERMISDFSDYDSNRLTRKDLDGILNYIVGNTAIANYEFHKVLFGDPYNFQVKKDGTLDETKRIKSFGSPAKPTLSSNYYNSAFTRIFNKNITNPKTLGYYAPKNTVSTITYSDVLIDSEYVSYAGVNEADAAAIHSVFMHRDMMMRHHKWGQKEEDWFQWEMAYTRQKLQNIIDFPYPETLKKQDRETLQKEKPEIYLSVIKPIVRGIKPSNKLIDPVLDKFSSTPLFFSGVEGTNLEKLFIKMYKEGVDYVIFESGRKVGSQGKNSFYNDKGEFNESPYIGKFKVNWSDYYIQVETAYDESKKQTRGSQITKIFSMDMFDIGTPISEDIKKRVDWNNQLLSEMTVLGYEKLLDKLGLRDNGTNFTIYDYKKLYETLKNEAFRRDMSENLKRIFELNPITAKPYYPIEASAKYDEIQKMLYSMVDKNIVSPKVNGGPHVQIPATGWESGIRKLKGNVFTSSSLKFYTKEDPYMEVLLPYWFKANVSEEKLLDYLNNNPEGQKILKAIGFRIPTQGMSAIEAIKVKGFLPREYGNTIVVPSEITTKAGSDFDIDKLNMYLKNVYIDKKGYPRAYEFKSPKTESELKDFYEEFLLEPYKKFKNKEQIISTQLSADELLTDAGLPTDEDEITYSLQKNYIPSLDEFLIEARDLSILEFNRRYLPNYKLALENEYFNSIESVVTDPLNFERLTQPTESKELKNLADKIAEIRGTQESKKVSSLLDINFLDDLRHAFLVAKKWVGIGAVNITGHSQAQRTNVYIDITDTELSKKDREILGDGTIQLPHNTDSQGRPTMSALKDRAGQYISDKISRYLTAFVDVAKDPYILQLIFSNKVVGTTMFLERIGVPTSTVSLFMNQPIIRDLVNYSDLKGFSGLSNPYWLENFIADNPKWESKNPKSTFNPATLESQMKKPDTDEQLAILREFLKYHKMAEHNFKFTQATNWDTARFTSGAIARRKQIVLNQQLKSNIFKSPQNILDVSNNGRIMEAVLNSKEAIESISDFIDPGVREQLNRVLDPYLSASFVNNDTVEYLDVRILKSFIDFLVQKRHLKINVGDLNRIVQRIKSVNPIDYNNNPIFSKLEFNVNNEVKITPFPRNIIDKNTISSYFDELRELSVGSEDKIKKDSVYSDIVKLAFLQGTNDYQSILSYIPMKDVAEVLNIKPTADEAKIFADLHMFEKNNWKDDNIVPYMKKVHPQNFPFNNDPRILRLSEKFNSNLIDKPVIKADKYSKTFKKNSASRLDLSGTQTKFKSFQEAIKPLIDKRDFSFTDKIGYQKVMLSSGEPLTTTDAEGNLQYYYRQTNLLGTRGIKEYSVTEKSSQLENRAVKLKNTLSDEQVIAKVTGRPEETKDPFTC